MCVLNRSPFYGLFQDLLCLKNTPLLHLRSPLLDSDGVISCPELLLSPEWCGTIYCDNTGCRPVLRCRFEQGKTIKLKTILNQFLVLNLGVIKMTDPFKMLFWYRPSNSAVLDSAFLLRSSFLTSIGVCDIIFSHVFFSFIKFQWWSLVSLDYLLSISILARLHLRHRESITAHPSSPFFPQCYKICLNNTTTIQPPLMPTKYLIPPPNYHCPRLSAAEILHPRIHFRCHGSIFTTADQWPFPHWFTCHCDKRTETSATMWQPTYDYHYHRCNPFRCRWIIDPWKSAA